MKAMTKHRSHSAAFKRQDTLEFVAGETLHGLSKRHDISRQLIRIWLASTRPAPSTTTFKLLTCSRNMKQRLRRSNAWLVGRPSKSSS
jgi:hypothetical protein